MYSADNVFVLPEFGCKIKYFQGLLSARGRYTGKTETRFSVRGFFKFWFVGLLTCHCEERSDAAIPFHRYLLNEIAVLRAANVLLASRWHHKRMLGFFEWNNPAWLVIREDNILPYEFQIKVWIPILHSALPAPPKFTDQTNTRNEIKKFT